MQKFLFCNELILKLTVYRYYKEIYQVTSLQRISATFAAPVTPIVITNVNAHFIQYFEESATIMLPTTDKGNVAMSAFFLPNL